MNTEQGALPPEQKAAPPAVREAHGLSLKAENALAPLSAAAGAMNASALAEVKFAMEMALAYPRDEDESRAKLMVCCKRFAFADKALYKYRRGGATVEGPSVQMAKEIGKRWRNIRWGQQVIHDDETSRTVRCYAWDMESNTKQEADVQFEKKVQRKTGGKDSPAEWVPCTDERELLELTNRNASKGVRNCIIALIPWDLVQDLVLECKATVAREIKDDPEKFRKGVIANFAKLGISPKELVAYVGRPLEQVRDDATIALLRGVYKRLDDGEATWQDVLAEKHKALNLDGPPPTSAVNLRSVIDAAAEDGGNGGEP